MKLNLLGMLLLVLICVILSAGAAYLGMKERIELNDKNYQSNLELKYMEGYDIGQWDGFSATVEYLNNTNQLKDSTVSLEITDFLPLLRKYDKKRHIKDRSYKFRGNIVEVPITKDIKFIQ